MPRQKQTQVQNVKIIVGEQKRKRAPARRAQPRRGPAQPQRPPGGGGGGGGGGGAPLPRPPPAAGAPDYYPFIAQRAGPIVESQSQIQQLVRPLQQSLSLLERSLPLSLPVPKREEQLSAQDIREYVARYVENLPMVEEPQRAAQASFSAELQPIGDMGTQTTISLPDHSFQYQIVGPPIPLIRAVSPPLVDAIIGPDEKQPEEPILEEEEEVVLPQRPAKAQQVAQPPLTVEEIQRLNRTGGITREFLNQFQVKAKRTANQRGKNLLEIGRALGLTFGAQFDNARKAEVINKILEDLASKRL